MLNIKILYLGSPPPRLNTNKILSHKSNIFETNKNIDSIALNRQTDLDRWGYSDGTLYDSVNMHGNNSDIVFVLTQAPLEYNWFTRPIGGNFAAVTFYEVKDYLREENIPLENFLIRVIYAYSFAFLENGNKIPDPGEFRRFVHDDSRGCIFDMNGIKSDVVLSAVEPNICDFCKIRLLESSIPENTIENSRKILKKIRKPLYYRIVDATKNHPISAIFIATIWAIIIGIVTNYIADYLIRFTRGWIDTH